MKRQLRYGQLEFALGDIVEESVDAIVNAANTKLAGGGGVDGAIHRAAGPDLKRLCQAFPANDLGQRCATGDVRTTGAGNLRAKIVIHAVGPFYSNQSDTKAHAQLRSVHELSLREAVKHECRSIAFPAISTGAYRFPVSAAALTAIDAVCRFLDAETGIDTVRFVLFSESHFDAYSRAATAWNAD